MKVLLDTSYILPVFGVDVDVPDVRKQLLHISRKATLLVNSLSILEAKWIVLKLSKRSPGILDSFKSGLEFIVMGKGFSVIPFHLPEIDFVATGVYLHHRDYIDCSILASAHVEADVLATLEAGRMRELAELLHYKYPEYRKLGSRLVVATLKEALEMV